MPETVTHLIVSIHHITLNDFTVSSIFILLYFVLEAFALLKHLCLCLCLCLCLSPFHMLKKMLQAFEVIAYSMYVLYMGSHLICDKKVSCEILSNPSEFNEHYLILYIEKF